jgi:hypothetical protein
MSALSGVRQTDDCSLHINASDVVFALRGRVYRSVFSMNGVLTFASVVEQSKEDVKGVPAPKDETLGGSAWGQILGE